MPRIVSFSLFAFVQMGRVGEGEGGSSALALAQIRRPIYSPLLPRACTSASANSCLGHVFWGESVIAQAAVTVFTVLMEANCK